MYYRNYIAKKLEGLCNIYRRIIDANRLAFADIRGSVTVSLSCNSGQNIVRKPYFIHFEIAFALMKKQTKKWKVKPVNISVLSRTVTRRQTTSSSGLKSLRSTTCRLSTISLILHLTPLLAHKLQNLENLFKMQILLICNDVKALVKIVSVFAVDCRRQIKNCRTRRGYFRRAVQ